jgi:hypothetical protein
VRWQGLLKCCQINPKHCFDITQQSKCTHPFSANKFCTVVPNICSIIMQFFPLHSKSSITCNAPRRKYQITVWFTSHSRIIGHQYGTCSMSSFWHK